MAKLYEMKQTGGRVMNLVGGFDIGNGYTKAAVLNMAGGGVTDVDMPSCASVVPNPTNVKPEPSEIGKIVDSMYEHLDVQIGSHMVSEGRRLFIGNRAMTSGIQPFEFNVASHLSKANDPLSVILLLSSIAGKAMKDLWATDHKFTPDVTVLNVVAVLALPIREYVQHGKSYRANLMSRPHMITVHNFDVDVVFQINFVDVAVLPEGAAAQYALNDRDEAFMNLLLSRAKDNMLQVYARKDGKEDAEAAATCRKNILFDTTAKDIFAASNTIGVDIGEGTVNFPVYLNGEFNTDISSTLPIGYGSVLAGSLKDAQDQGFGFKTRKELSEYLKRKPTHLQARRFMTVQNIVDNHVTSLVESIAVEFSSVMGQAGSMVEVVYVYGGGATPIREELYRKLMDTMRVNQQEDVILLYLDSSWSRELNREGLLVAANARAKAYWARQQAAAAQTKE